MRQISLATSRADAPGSELDTITTTFGDLIGAINEGVKPEEDYLVPEIVMHLIETGRIKFH
jgi:hypothetical protein